MLLPINLDFADLNCLKLNSFINKFNKQNKMEKKAAVTSPIDAAPAKKDKNINPLLKNGVTNKDVSVIDKRINLL